MGTSGRDLSLSDITRKDLWDYPLDALREALINAVIHRDYIGNSYIEVRIFDDKIIFWNAGKLCPP